MTEFKYAKMSKSEHAFVDWMVRDQEISPKYLDIDPHGVKGEITFNEAVAFAMRKMPWRKYMPMLERANPLYPHPLDDRNWAPPIKRRISEFLAEAEIHALNSGLAPTDPKYCAVLHDRFFELAGPSYHNGGLCLAYDYDGGYLYDLTHVRMEDMTNLTSKDFFDNCMAPTSPGTYMGSCTENGQARTAIFQDHPHCPLDTVATESHAYAVPVGEKDIMSSAIDASEIGGTGWARKVNPAAEYYNSDGMPGVSHLIEQNVYIDRNRAILASERHTKAIGIDYENEQSNPELCDPALARSSVREILDVYDRVVQSNHQSISPFLNISRYMSQLPYETAVNIGIEILKKWPYNNHALLPLAWTVALDDPEQVLKICDRLKAEFPNSGFCETMIGLAYQNSGDHMRALEAFAMAVQINRNNFIARQAAANSLLNFGEYDTAEKVLNDVVEVIPNSPGTHMLLANIAQMRGDMETAFVEAKKEYTIFVGNMNAQILYAQLSNATGKPVEAIATLNSLLDSNPWIQGQTLGIIYNQLAGSYILAGKLDTAHDIFAAIADRNLLDLQAIMGLALQLGISSFKLDSAEVLAESLAQENPLYALMVAYIALMKNDLGRAEKLYEGLTPEYKKLPMTRSLLASLEIYRGNSEEARRINEEIASSNKYDFSAQSMLIFFDLNAGLTESARKKYSEMIKDFPDVFQIKLMHPAILVNEGKYGEAFNEALTLINEYQNHPTALNTAGMALLEMGMPEAALPYVEHSYDIHPYDPGTKTILAKIHLEMGNLDEAEDLASQAVVDWIDIDTGNNDYNPHTILGEIEARRGKMAH